MIRSFTFAATAILLSGTALAADPLPPQAPAGPTAAVQPAAPAKPKRVCHKEVDTGSLVQGRTVCKTLKGDRGGDAENAALVEQMRSVVAAGGTGH